VERAILHGQHVQESYAGLYEALGDCTLLCMIMYMLNTVATRNAIIQTENFQMHHFDAAKHFTTDGNVPSNRLHFRHRRFSRYVLVKEWTKFMLDWRHINENLWHVLDSKLVYLQHHNWFTHYVMQIVKQNWILWTGTFRGCMMENLTLVFVLPQYSQISKNVSFDF